MSIKVRNRKSVIEGKKYNFSLLSYSLKSVQNLLSHSVYSGKNFALSFPPSFLFWDPSYLHNFSSTYGFCSSDKQEITNNRNTLLSKAHNELKLEACGKFSWFWLMKIYSFHCETFSLQPDIKATLTGSTPTAALYNNFFFKQ